MEDAPKAWRDLRTQLMAGSIGTDIMPSRYAQKSAQNQIVKIGRSYARLGETNDSLAAVLRAIADERVPDPKDLERIAVRHPVQGYMIGAEPMAETFSAGNALKMPGAEPNIGTAVGKAKAREFKELIPGLTSGRLRTLRRADPALTEAEPETVRQGTPLPRRWHRRRVRGGAVARRSPARTGDRCCPRCWVWVHRRCARGYRRCRSRGAHLTVAHQATQDRHATGLALMAEPIDYEHIFKPPWSEAQQLLIDQIEEAIDPRATIFNNKKTGYFPLDLSPAAAEEIDPRVLRTYLDEITRIGKKFPATMGGLVAVSPTNAYGSFGQALINPKTGKFMGSAAGQQPLWRLGRTDRAECGRPAWISARRIREGLVGRWWHHRRRAIRSGAEPTQRHRITRGDARHRPLSTRMDREEREEGR